MYDAIIVGAGPAGSSAAYACAKGGLKTLLLEKYKFPRDKPCGGGVFPYVLNKLGIDAKEVLERKTKVMRVFLDYKELTSFEFPVYMHKRINLDNFLAKRAQKEGAELRDNEEVVSVKIKDKVIVETKKSTYESKLIVGADGFYSKVARDIGLYQRREVYGALEIEDYMKNSEIKKRYGETHFNIYLFSDFLGYYWIFPKNNTINIGNGLYTGSKNQKEGLFKFMEDLDINLDKAKLKGYTIPGEFLPKIYSERILLCGDAAGFVDPLTGGGIDLAIRSGEKAGNLAAEAIDRNEFSDNFLSKYVQDCSDIINCIKKQKKRLELLKQLFKFRLAKPAAKFAVWAFHDKIQNKLNSEFIRQI